VVGGLSADENLAATLKAFEAFSQRQGARAPQSVR